MPLPCAQTGVPFPERRRLAAAPVTGAAMTTAQPLSEPIEIFRPGTFTSEEGEVVTFSSADLAEMAAGYMPATDPAPFVIGHPETDDPAYGWVDRLDVDGDVLRAHPHQVDAGFAEAVGKGRYKRVSARFYGKSSPNNPAPGRYYLKHVGFLGGRAPAVKGLKTVSFSEDATTGLITFETTLKEDAMSTQDDKTKTGDQEVSFAEREAALATREAAIAEGEAALAEKNRLAAEAEVKARHDANVSFAESLIAAGKLAPARKDEVILVADAVAANTELSFGEGDDKKSPLQLLKGWFEAAKPVVSFAEVAKPDGHKPVTLSFAAPAGFTVDVSRVALHQAALELQAENASLSYTDAVKRAENAV